MENKRKIIIVATILIIVLSLLLCACDDNSNNNSNHSNNNSSNAPSDGPSDGPSDDPSNTPSDQESSKSNPLETAYNALYEEFGWSACYTLGSDKSYLQVDTNPFDINNYYYEQNIQILKSAVTALKLPDYIYQRMLKTTALQGRQEATVNGINVSWTYHPNKGLEAIFILA